MNIVVVDYGMGNIFSVQSAVKFLGFDCVFTDSAEKILNADKIILPGVGSYRKAMNNIVNRGIDDVIKEAVLNRKTPILGICLGMQILGLSSTEDGYALGLGFFEGEVDRFDNRDNLKIPHIGYNEIIPPPNSLLFRNLEGNSDFYFVHSYRMKSSVNSGVATCAYGETFVAAFESNNVYGTQFHPEKSQSNGLIVLSNFLSRT